MARASIRAALGAVLCALGFASASAQTALISATQVRPGELVARASIDAPTAPVVNELALQLDATTTLVASKLASVPPSAKSAALLICLDRSGSMGAAAITAMQDVLRKTLVQRVGEAQLPMSVAIVAFGTHSNHLLSLTSDPAQVAGAVTRLSLDKERAGKTRLNDAVAGGLAELRASGAGWKRLLIVSDGNDEGSTLSQTALIERATAAPSIAIDAVGFGSLAASASGSLSTLAGATGGRFAIANTRAELADALGQMIRQAVPKPQYDITFAYAAASDGRKAEAAALLYRPKGGTVVLLPLGTEVSAAVATGALATPTPAPTPNKTATIVEWIARVPMAVWIGLGFVLLAVVVFLILRSRRREESSPSVPPLPLSPFQPSRPPPPPPLGPTRIIDPPLSTAVPAPPPSSRHTVIAHRWPAPGERRTVALLHGISGAAQGRQFRITAASTRIGAAADNELAFAGDDFMSSHHAVVRAEANALYVIDLGSRNGSEFNGVRFNNSTRSLSPGDRITLGRTTFEVAIADAPARIGRSHDEPRVN